MRSLPAKAERTMSAHKTERFRKEIPRSLVGKEYTMAKKFKDGFKFKGPKLKLHDETKKGITAVLLFVGALITALSMFGAAGEAGDALYRGLGLLFGWGYFLVPLSLILAGVAILKSLHEELYGTPFFGITLFLISFLGVLQMFLGGNIENGRGGGYLGLAISYPFLKFLGVYASYIILIALIFVSLLVAFNISLKKLADFIFDRGSKKIKDAAQAKNGAAEPTVLNSLMDKIMPTPTFKVKNLGVAENTGNKPAPEVRETREEKKAKKDEMQLLQSKMTMADYKFPNTDLLEPDSGEPTSGDIKANANIIKRTLQHFGIEVEMAEVNIGPTVTQYTFRPAQGVKLSKITTLQNDLSLALAAHPIRIEAPIPGRSLVGIELPNKAVMKVRLKNLVEQPDFAQNHKMLTIALGRDVAGLPVYAGLEKMPHMLIAGATGTGKSVCLNSIITSLLYRQAPNFLKLILIDPKRVEFPVYNGLPHLLTPVIVEAEKMVNALRWAVSEMERRFEVLSGVQARDIVSYNKKFVDGEISEPLPYIVIIVDELADLMASHGREVEATIVRLAQMSRAVGIHLVLATQRPSVEVITGLIKANITSRVAFQVASQIDSRTILDGSGADKLLGNGDMLFLSGDVAKPRRVQGTFVSDKEVKKVVEFLAKQNAVADFTDDITRARTAQGAIFGGGGENGGDDDLYNEARETVIQSGKASASLLQRRLRVGYARAARLLDMLEDNGVVGPGDGAKPREVLVDGIPGVPGNPKVGDEEADIF
ncbi:MAG: DNA translocase FtsK [Candidatus Portnoybacteria bacterium]|nr:DNA translocase FtsK [Candidatus Portnoybacteria bacterium]MDD4983199.1 DNA translocase FtsK [Candidatus Portnoybacteria bacterium]